ncbi:hypothetical protein SEA_ET2BRUTUS_76 [Mycobacterium phage Et2Brutus]|nr:hypothetical protein SEA_ET2BRUTUS_76 [Mycobacterium phage Et2Brutus]
MPLVRLSRMFPDVETAAQELIVSKPGWLFAWRQKAWLRGIGDPNDASTTLLVYKSPLVTETKRMYRPILEEIMAAEHMDVMGQGVIQDEDMMHGQGEFVLYRLCSELHHKAYQNIIDIDRAGDAIRQVFLKGVSFDRYQDQSSAA